MDSHEHANLGDFASQHHGVFTRHDALRLGVSRPTIDKRTRSGLYRRLEPGVYAVAGSPVSLRQKLVSVAFSFQGLAAISHQTAAELWGITRRGLRVVEVTTTRWDRVRRPNAVVHESLDLLAADVVDLDGIPVTTPARTVVDLGASNKWIVESALDEGIRKDLFTLDQVEAFVRRVARRGRRGVGVIRPLLAARRQWGAVTESVLEDEFRKLIVEWDLPMPELQYEVRDELGLLVCRADFAYPDCRLLIELDGAAHHLDRGTFRRDRAKQNRAVVIGWTVLRYTWWDIVEAPTRVQAEIRAAIAPPT
jgi:hypothetical protein